VVKAATPRVRVPRVRISGDLHYHADLEMKGAGAPKDRRLGRGGVVATPVRQGRTGGGRAAQQPPRWPGGGGGGVVVRRKNVRKKMEMIIESNGL
jgi:hypothetical protein